MVLKALRDMKEKGLLAKPSSVYQNHLAVLPEDKVSVSYEVSHELFIVYCAIHSIANLLISEMYVQKR